MLIHYKGIRYFIYHNFVGEIKLLRMEDVKLLGTKESIFTQRIIWALKLKGICYEFIEQDFSSRSSPLLVKLNPVYNKVPVIVHDGKSLAESLVILEYIEETWPLINPLFPLDPFQRASTRFWARFVDGKVKILSYFNLL